MISFSYLAFILFGILGMGIIDWKYKLALFFDLKRALKTLLIMVSIFIVWDILGIKLKIFFSGTSKFDTGIMLGPQFPLEEIFFLTLLCYMALIVYRKFSK